MAHNTLQFLGKDEIRQFELKFPDSSPIFKSMQEITKTLTVYGKTQLYLGFMDWSRLYGFMIGASGKSFELGYNTGSLPVPTLAEAFLKEYEKKLVNPYRFTSKKREELSSRLFLPAVMEVKRHIIYPTAQKLK